MSDPYRRLLQKPMLVAAGCVCVGLGALGIVLPMMPATPFFLLAAWLFSRSSPRFSAWLLNHRVFGQIIAAYRERRGMTFRQKVATLAALWLSLLASALVVGHLWAWLLLSAIACGVTVHLVRMPTRRSDRAASALEPVRAEPTRGA